MNTIDLNNPPPNHKFGLSIARDETDAEHHVRLFKDVALFVAALGFAMLIVYLCYSTLTASIATAEEKKWAMSVLSATTGGLIGYLIRK